MRSIPRLDKGALRAIRILLRAQFFDADFGAVLGKDDILLFHVLGAALSELVGVEVDLMYARGRVSLGLLGMRKT